MARFFLEVAVHGCRSLSADAPHLSAAADRVSAQAEGFGQTLGDLRAGVPSLRSHTHGRHVPHVSYAVLRTWELTAVSAAVAGLGALAPVELTFDGVWLFRRGRAWLLAGAAAEFVTRQERVVDAVTATEAELHKHYRPGRWLPHCSVAPRAGLAQLPVLVAAVYDVLPLETRLDRVTLIDSSTGELWPVSTSP